MTPLTFQVLVVAAGSNMGTLEAAMLRNSMNSSAVFSSTKEPPAFADWYMISLMTTGPTSGYGFGAPGPVRNWPRVTGLSTPNDLPPAATNSTTPALLTNLS